MKQKIIIFIFVIVYISLILSYIVSINKNNYIVMGTSTFIYYDKNNNIKSIKYKDNIDKSLNYEKFKVYIDNEFNDYYVTFNNDSHVPYINIYTMSNEIYYSNTYFLGYIGNLNLNVSTPTRVSNEEIDKNKLSKILKSKSLEDSNLFLTMQQMDIDNDGDKETIYTVSNISLKDSYYYTFLIESDGTVIDINLVINDEKTSIKSRHAWSIDLDKDNNYEIILARNSGDDTITYFDIYKYDSSNKTIKLMK